MKKIITSLIILLMQSTLTIPGSCSQCNNLNKTTDNKILYKDTDEITLSQTISDNQFNWTKHLIKDHGKDVNSPDKRGDYPLHIAVCKNSDLVAYLLKNGADPNQKNNLEETPLMIAAYLNNKNTAQLLLESGADINLQDLRGKTSLNFAITHGKYKMVKFLHRSGADLTRKNNLGDNPINQAAKYNQLETLKYLINNYPEKLTDEQISRLFSIALINKHFDILQYLIQTNEYNKPEDFKPLANFDEKSIFYAINKLLEDDRINKYPDIIEYVKNNLEETNKELLLLKINKKNEWGSTDLHRAITHGNFERVKVLHQIGAYLTRKNNFGDNSIDHAAKFGNLEILKYLINNYPKNLTDKEKIRLFSIALINKDFDILQYLIDIKQSPNNKEKKSKSLANLDEKSIFYTMCNQLLKDNDINKYPDIAECVKNNLEAIVKARLLLIINEEDEWGNTNIHRAIGNSNYEKVKDLHQNGADLTIKNNVGDSPIYYAAKLGNLKILKYLINNYPKNLTDKEKIRLFNIALINKDILEYLIRTNQLPNDPKTTLNNCIEKGHSKALEFYNKTADFCLNKAIQDNSKKTLKNLAKQGYFKKLTIKDCDDLIKMARYNNKDEAVDYLCMIQAVKIINKNKGEKTLDPMPTINYL